MFLRQTLIKYQEPISLDIGTKIFKVTKSSSKKYSFFSSDFQNNFFKIRNYFKKAKIKNMQLKIGYVKISSSTCAHIF